MLRLKSENENKDLEPRFIKQRSEQWFNIRAVAAVTGSGLHNSLGFRGLKEQKKMLNKDKQENFDTHSDEVKAKLEHGTKNEINAVATIVGIVLPMYFPGCSFVEEGCYKIAGNTRESLMVVSPDGSIRRVESGNESVKVGPALAAVEIKCPYPRSDTLPVHYIVPEYYVCQCLAEMVALDTSRLIYVSYSAESSTVFEMTFDESLWNDMWSIVSEIFDKKVPVITSSVREAAKTLKPRLKSFVEKNVVFLAEVPSMTAVDSGLCQTAPNTPFLSAWPRQNMDTSEFNVAEAIVQNSIPCKATTETCYNLMRRKAAEVMVWVLTNIDRNSKVEIPCSLPVAFGLKDYKLNSAAMRKATNYVIDKCIESGIRVCSFATDGQWIQLMNRDSNGKPMTVYQLQKDIWTKVKAISKSTMANTIGNLNKVKNSSGNLEDSLISIRLENGCLYVSSKTLAFQKIKTCTEKSLWSGKIKSKSNDAPILSTNSEDENDDTFELNGITRIPEGDVSSFEEIMTPAVITDELEQNLQEAISKTISCEINELLHESSQAADENVSALDGVLTQKVLANDDEVNELNSINSDLFEDNNSSFQLVHENDNDYVNSDRSSQLLTPDTLSNILTILKTNPRTSKKWVNCTIHDLENTLTTKSLMEKLTHKELDVIAENLLQCVSQFPVARVSWKKEKKIEYLTLLIARRVTKIAKFNIRKKKLKSPDSLGKLCLKKIQSKAVPKGVLNVAYASYIYPREFETWQESMNFKKDMKISGYEEEIPFWFAYPEKYGSNGELIGKSIDCSHNYTHLRVRSCTTGIGNVTADAWKAVAKSNETRLNVAMVEDLLDKQSVPNAQTNFSEEVEMWMRDHNFVDAANLTKVIREWYEASDAPGISVHERVKRLISMRKFILNGVDFGQFPPCGRYFNKIPFVTFEGILIDIDTNLQLHGFIGPYNIRSVGSLAAETTVGILQELSPSNTSSIKARDVPALVSNVVEIMTCKINTNRGFFMRTARSNGVYPIHETDDTNSKNQDCSQNTCISERCILLRNHPFDQPERKRVARKIRFGTVSGPSVPARGAQSVRQWHRKDESKILQSKRLGIDIDTNVL